MQVAACISLCVQRQRRMCPAEDQVKTLGKFCPKSVYSEIFNKIKTVISINFCFFAKHYRLFSKAVPCFHFKLQTLQQHLSYFLVQPSIENEQTGCKFSWFLTNYFTQFCLSLSQFITEQFCLQNSFYTTPTHSPKSNQAIWLSKIKRGAYLNFYIYIHSFYSYLKKLTVLVGSQQRISALQIT